MCNYKGNRGYIPYHPNEKIRIAFLYQVASYWPSWESFYMACIKDDRFEVRLLYLKNESIHGVQMDTAEDFLQQKGYEYEVYSAGSMDQFRPHIAVFQSPYDSVRHIGVWALTIRQKGIRILYIPYGIEITDTEFSQSCHFDTSVVRNAWRVYTLSDAMRDEYIDHFVSKEVVKAVGIPKLDGLFYKEQYSLPQHIKQKANGRKIILWKVHFPNIILEKGNWVQTTPYLEQYLEFSDWVDQYSNLFFIFRPHPKFHDNTIRADVREKAVELIQRLETKENVFIDTGDDYRLSLLNADAIMIDRSALMVEAGAVGVPVLFMSNEDFYEPLTKPVYDLVRTYYQGNRAEDMRAFMEMFLLDQDEKRAEREAAAKKIFQYMDGHCGERIKDNICNSLVEEMDRESKIRLIIMGTGKVCGNFISDLKLTENSEFEIIAFSDNNSNKWDNRFLGIKIIPPSHIKEYEYDYIVIATTHYFKPLYKQLIFDFGIDHNRVLAADTFISQFSDILKCES